MTYISVKQAAEYLQLAEVTILRMIKSKRIPAAKVGKRYRLSKEYINDWFIQPQNIKMWSRE